MKTTSKVLLALLAAFAARSFASKADCDAYKKAQKQVTDLMAQQEKLTAEGKSRAAKCNGDQGCLKGLDPLRSQVKALGVKMNDTRDEMQKFGSLCD